MWCNFPHGKRQISHEETNIHMWNSQERTLFPTQTKCEISLFTWKSTFTCATHLWKHPELFTFESVIFTRESADFTWTKASQRWISHLTEFLFTCEFNTFPIFISHVTTHVGLFTCENYFLLTLCSFSHIFEKVKHVTWKSQFHVSPCFVFHMWN